MSSTNNVSLISAQLLAQQTTQVKAASSTANSAQASFAATLNAVNAGVGQTNTITVSSNTSLSDTAKSALASGTAAVASTDLASSLATSLLNILT